MTKFSHNKTANNNVRSRSNKKSNKLIALVIVAVIFAGSSVVATSQVSESKRQHNNITINARQLQAGMYMYSLLVDGREIDTKRMILTDK